MPERSLPPNLPTCGDIAADLRRIAEAFDTIADLELQARPYVVLDLQPGGSDAEIIARTDALAGALFGATGTAHQMSNGTWHYKASGAYGLVGVDVYDRIADPGPHDAERDAELERRKDADPTGQEFGRSDTEDPPAAAGPVPSLMVGYPRSALAQDGRRLHAEPSAPAFVRVA